MTAREVSAAKELSPWEGSAAPPRSNGELLFESPWESRAFGLIHALCDAGTLSWDAFRKALIAEIAAWERDHPGEEYRYYERWLAASESVLLDGQIFQDSELRAKERELAARDEHAPAHSHSHRPPAEPGN